MRKAKRILDRGPARRGVAAAELAVVLPLLLLVVLGAVDLGRFCHYYIVVSNSARAGAGYGSVHPYTDNTYNAWVAQVQDACRDEIGASWTIPDPVVIATEVNNVLNRVSVQVDYNFETIVPWPGIPSSLTVRRVVVMRYTR